MSDNVSRLSRNIAASLLRVVANVIISLALPAYLVSRLPVAVYSAWILILQLGAYVSFLDLGIQTSVAKFVAEFEARKENDTASEYASAGLAMTSAMALCGVLLTFILAWQVPRLFGSMPVALQGEARLSVVLVGVSLSVALLCSVFAAVFIGLQRYAIPNAILVVNRVLVTICVCVAVFFHGGLQVMAGAFAIVNLLTSGLQVFYWRKMAANIAISFSRVTRNIFTRMVHYSAYLAVWSVGMLLVSGLDVTIVGHFDYRRTAFYAVAVMPTNLLLLVISSVIGPMMPASAAMSTRRSPQEMGDVFLRVSRYAVLLLLLVGLPLIVFGYPILKLWVGAYYAANCLLYLRILLMANIVRNTCLPYATMVIATGRQKAATAATVAEAVVNVVASVILASRFGAIGVAYGTLLGAFVSVSMHLMLSMKLTQNALHFSRRTLLLRSFMRASSVTLPSLSILVLQSYDPTLANHPAILLVWFAATALIAWLIALDRRDRGEFTSRASRWLKPSEPVT